MADSVEHGDQTLPTNLTLFPLLLEALSKEGADLVPHQLEAVRHLTTISEGPRFSIRRHLRAQAAGRNVVAKVLNRCISPSAAKNDACTIADLVRMLKEVRILNYGPFRKHENIANLDAVEFGIFSGDPFEICPVLALEAAELGSLDTLQSKPASQTLPWSARTSLLFDVASGLKALHDHGVLHGDLNPSHILIHPHPQRGLLAKLIGFGEAQIISNLKSAPALLGTAPWRAPEIEEASISLENVLKADIFSLGLVLWSICVMQDPFAKFDLPIDPASNEESIKFIVRQAYLFRCIPFFIQHTVRELDDESLRMLEELFECSVRLTPASRDLSKILRILTPHSGREALPPHEEDFGVGLENPCIDMPEQSLTSITAGVSVLKDLPSLVAKEFVKTLQSILDLPPTEENRKIIEGSSWTLFLCHFYGYGTKRSVSAAIYTLIRHPSDPQSPAILVDNTISVLKKALGEEFPPEIALDGLSLSLEDGRHGSLGSWKTLRRPPAVYLLEHGVKVEETEILDYLDRVRMDEGLLEKDIGSCNTLLHMAAIFGLSDQISFLGNFPQVDIDAQNDRGETPVYLACVYGHIETVKVLLELDANASINTHEQKNGLHWLSSFPKEVVQQLADDLFEKGADLVLPDREALRYMQWTSMCPVETEFIQTGKIRGNPLLTAISNIDIDSVLAILCVSKDFISMCSPETRLFVTLGLVFEPALRLACELHLFDIINILCLVLRGILLSLPKDSVPSAADGLFQELRSGLCEVGEVFTALTQSTSHIRAALDMRFHLHRLSYHESSWKIACRQTIELLVDRGFVTNIVRTERGPLGTAAFAIHCGNNEALRTLIQMTMSRSGQLEVVDSQGYTLVHHALSRGRLDSLKILAEHGAVLDLRQHRNPEHCLTGAGASYLHVLGSLRLEDPEFVHIFLEHGVPATIEDNQGSSALSLALIRGAFSVARVLLQQGASLLEKGRFILSYEDNNSLFIVSPELDYTIFHIIAQCYSPSKQYPRLIDMVIQKYGSREHLEVRANNPAKSTAVFTAVAQLNPIVVETLVNAGASMADTDSEGRTPLQYARVVHSKLIYNVHGVSSGNKIEDLERITSVIIILVEKGGRLEHIDIPKINAALDLAEPLLKRMMCSEHKVAYMRHLEDSLMATVKSGYSDMISTLDIDGLDLIRRIVLRKVKPCLRMDLEYRVLPLSSDASMPFEYEAVRERIPWFQELTNRDLQQFQMAAAFEWLLDLIQANDVPPNSSQLGTEALLKYALTRNPADLPFDPKIVRFPYGLLEWYGRIIATNSFLGEECDWEQRLGFLEILKERELARKQGIFPLPAFDESFRDFHFNKLQPKELDVENSFASISTVLRCRCYYEDIGSCTRFKLMRITQRMSSIDSETWKSRVKEYSAGIAGFEGKLSNWKELATGSRKDLQHISILAQLLSDTETPESAFLLAHPKNLGEIPVEPVVANSTAAPPSDNSGLSLWEQIWKLRYAPFNTEQHRDGILLWVDALCINQDDMDEKAKLVNQMYSIYRAARTVTVWLGAADPDTPDLMNRIHNFISTYTRISEPEGSLQEAKLLKCPPIWYSTTILPAVIHLFDRPYWKRLWVMQEITASAPCEGFYVGEDVISWNEMLLLIRHHRNLTDLHKATDEFTEVQLGRAFGNLSHTRRLMAMAEMYHTSLGYHIGIFHWNLVAGRTGFHSAAVPM
ncbi:unnamed protein product [Clonostachys rhizophaga]|uniref:Protein kinase domain-containing protein n=1 Tax=Clonostachys rhizophaga TaxID=160324 RepID=A0A9N9VAL8_9HYPO|nr:unnamed protein product [Clonostachys rhizophaga]